MKAMNLNWKVALFSVFFLMVFLWLGFWQVNRAVEKTALLAHRAALSQTQGIRIDVINEKKSEAGQPVLLEGQFDPKLRYLLDNRILSGKVGYELIVPFDDVSGLTVLVNLGFIAMGMRRDVVPDLPTLPTMRVRFKGQLYHNQTKIPAENVLGDGPIFVIQVAEPVTLPGLDRRKLYPDIVRIEASDPNALPRYWPVTTMLPARHYAYAVTWFAMALAVTISFIVFTFRRVEEDDR